MAPKTNRKTNAQTAIYLRHPIVGNTFVATCAWLTATPWFTSIFSASTLETADLELACLCAALLWCSLISLPHLLQNLASSLFLDPQKGQYISTTTLKS